MAPRLNLPRSIASAAILTRLATEHGMEITHCLAGTGITPSMLDDPAAEILAHQELRLVHNVVTTIGHIPALGLQAGCRYDLLDHGIWAFAVLSSPTVRHGWRIGVELMDISYSFARWRFDERDDEAVASADYSPVPPELRTFLLERDLAETMTVDHQVFGWTVPPTKVELSCPAPEYIDEFTALLGSQPEFDAPVTRLHFNRDVLDLPMPQANSHAAAIAERQAFDIMQRRRAREGVGATVREILLSRGVTIGQKEVAAELRISVRTLRRRLDDEQTSFRELLDETRQLLAEELLTIGTTVEDVADRLGYADASSFTHAFTRWTGTTPGRYARTRR
ncbi:AraC family transcriptional regulator [Nocardia nova]|nr:AraC family transcriptional regulator [Nocardia nova]